MTLWLKQSTAKVVSFGPFLDKTDGVTEETGLVSALDHASTGIKLSKNGGALTIRHATVTATTYDAYGSYLVTLDTTDTNTLGTLRMSFNEAATCLPVWQDFMVLPANVYDSLVGGSDYLDVSAVQFAGQTITASGGVTIPAATLASTTNITAGTISTVTTLTGHTPQTGDAYARLGAPAGASVSADIAALPTAAENASAVWDENMDVHIAGDSAGEKLVNTAVAAGAIQAKTDNLPATPADEATLTAMKGATFSGATDSLEAIRDRGDAAWATATGFSTLDAAGVRSAVGLASANLDTQLTAIDDLIDTEVAAIKTVVDGIDTKMGLPVITIADDIGAPAGLSLAADIAAVKAETALIQAKTTNLPAAPASTTNITAASGITVSAIGANVITATSIQANAITSAKIATDAIGAAQLAADAVAEIVDANWDEVASGHLTAGTTGLALVTAESVSGQIGAPVGVNISTDIAAIKSDTGTINTNTTAAAQRAAVGLASANLDTQLTAIDDLIDTEVAAIYTRIGAPVGASISADIAGITATVDAADVRAAIGMASANLDTQLAAIDDLIDTEVAAIYSRLGAPAGASVSADVAAIKAETATINTATGAAAIRTAVGLASANLDTQLTAIDDLIDTEVGAIKTKTDYLPSATAGAAGGLFIAGANAATTVNITGDITGNLSGSVGAVAANGITATSIATDAINAASVKADAVTKIQNGLATPTNITAAAGIALSAGERTTLADAILDRTDGATSGYTLREALEVMLAVLAGKLSGAATATITIRDVNDTKNVVVATTDASGNRTAVTVTP